MSGYPTDFGEACEGFMREVVRPVWASEGGPLWLTSAQRVFYVSREPVRALRGVRLAGDAQWVAFSPEATEAEIARALWDLDSANTPGEALL